MQDQTFVTFPWLPHVIFVFPVGSFSAVVVISLARCSRNSCPLVSCLIRLAGPMFSAWSSASLGLGGSSSVASGRSRSPSRPGTVTAVPAGSSSLPGTEQPWSTGNAAADQWLEDQRCDPQVLNKFSALPKLKRKSIIIRCMDNRPQNLDAWLGACSRNWIDQDLEARVTGISNAHSPSAALSNNVVSGSSSLEGVSGSRRAVSLSPRHAPTPVLPTVPDAIELSSAIPKLSTDLFEAWPKNKSALIRMASESLSSGALAAFLTLPVQDQTAMAFTLMVAAPENSATRAALMDSWLQRLANLRGSGPASTVPPSLLPDPPASSCKVQFILAGLPTCMCAVVVASVQLILPKLHSQVRWDFCPVVHLNEEVVDGVPVGETFSQVGLSVREDISSLHKLVGQIGNLWEGWSSCNVKFVLVSCLSHDAGVCGSNHLQSHHLHTKANRWLWGMVSASAALRNRAGDINVADVLICPQTSSVEFAQEVTSLWGTPATGMERFGNDHLAGSPRPTFYCTPGGIGIVPVCEYESKSSQPIDNWTGPSLQVLTELHTNLPGFLPAHLSKLATEVLFSERELTQQETSVLKSMRVRHSSGGERLCSRPFWCRWYGYNQTPVQKVLLDHDACVGMVIPTTGTEAPPGLPSASTSPCGQDRYCLGCERHLAMLSKGFQTYVVTDLLLALLTKASRTWTGQDAGMRDSWSRSSAVSREHMCGDDCPLLRR